MGELLTLSKVEKLFAECGAVETIKPATSISWNDFPAGAPYLRFRIQGPYGLAAGRIEWRHIAQLGSIRICCIDANTIEIWSGKRRLRFKRRKSARTPPGPSV